MAIIRSVECIPLAIPFKLEQQASGFAGADWSKIYMLLVKVQSDDGITGWGEAFAFNCWRSTQAALEDMVTPLAIGADDSDPASLSRQWQQAIHTFGRYGATLYALSGVDIALWDIAAQRKGLPLRDLLGPGRRERIAGYASLFKYDDADSVAAACESWIGKGAKHIKLHENDPQIVARAREVCGPDIPLMLDVNCCWNENDALAAAQTMHELNLLWLEEPVFPPEDFEVLARLRKNASTAIAAGENACTEYQFRQMLDAHAVDYAQPSVTKVGGISEFIRVQELVHEREVVLAPHSPYFGPGFIATMHLIAAAQDEMLLEHFCLNPQASPCGDCIFMHEGSFTVPTEPGLGIVPDEDVIREFRIS